MKEFEHLMSVWQTQPKPETLSVDSVLKQVKKDFGFISRKLYWNIVSMILTGAGILAGMFFFAIRYWTTYAGILIILAAILVYTCIMIRDYKLLNKHDATMSPANYLQNIKNYQRNRSIMNGWMYYLYTLLLSVGLSMYSIEVLRTSTLLFKIIACSLTVIWLLFVTFYVKDKIFKYEQEKLNLMIDRLVRLQNQFE